MPDLETIQREHELRMKTGSLVFAIEKSLGEFVIEQSISASIHLSEGEVLEGKDGASEQHSSVPKLVADSYLNDVFKYALKAAEGTATERSVKDFRKLCADNSIFEIRNAIAHPNIAFHGNYWYRTASIASDPLVDLLGLELVKRALLAAEHGRFEVPPDEWLIHQSPLIPNNIPKISEYSITGLIGRSKDIKEVKSLLKNKRIPALSIVSPGGVGKTSLILRVLEEISHDVDFNESFDQIVFVTAKQDVLTIDGIQSLSSSSTLTDIQSEILEVLEISRVSDNERFEETIAHSDSSKVLLCVDNLETILRDDPAAFNSLNRHLPESWRLIVTSRIPVDGALNHELDELSKESSQLLARKYSMRRGVSLSKQEVETIVESRLSNPLAIRLAIDAYNLGHPIKEAAGIAKERIADYSYSNLVDALNEVSLNVLECLFCKGSCTRQDTVETLEISVDDAQRALNILSQSSLVTRKTLEDDEDQYSLSEAVAELLLSNPKNIEVRGRIQAKLKLEKRKRESLKDQQSALGINKYSPQWIPDRTPSKLKDLLISANNALAIKNGSARQTAARELISDFTKLESQYSQSAIFHRAFAALLIPLRHEQGWRLHFEKAIELEPKDPLTRQLYGRALHFAHEYEEAERVLESLISEGWDDVNKGSSKLAYNVLIGYLTALLYQSKYDRLLDVTKDWRNAKSFNIVRAGFRIGAIKRSADHLGRDEERLLVSKLSQAFELVEEINSSDFSPLTADKEILKLYREIEYRVAQGYLSNSQEMSRRWLSMIAEDLISLSDRMGLSQQQIQEMIESYQSLDIPGNPFLDERWNVIAHPEFLAPSEKNSEDFSGYIEVIVYHIPNGSSADPFLFAKDKSNQQYYLKLSKLERGGPSRWKKLVRGSVAYIIPDTLPTEKGKAIPADMIRIPTD